MPNLRLSEEQASNIAAYLLQFGKKEVIFILKKETKNTSNIAIKINKEPLYKYVLRNKYIIFFENNFFNLKII